MINRSTSDTRTCAPGLYAALLCVFCSVTTLVPVKAVLAQGQEAVLEEIVVTSRRYEESIKDAPVAVNVMSQDFITNNRIDRQDDILNYTPGATWESFSKMQPVAAMRGIIAPTPGNASSESSIQTVEDDVVISKDFMKSPPLFDLQRVEVLRGPQGTSFGRNASVGLIHFINNRPSQETSASITGTAGSDQRYEVDGHFNQPLSDTTAIRIAFNHDEEDGQTESISSGDGLDGEKNTAVRASILFEPSDRFSAYAKLEYSLDRDEAPVRHGFVVPNGSDCSVPFVSSPPFQQDFFDNCSNVFKTEISAEDADTKFHTHRDILTASTELVWKLANDLTVTSVTGYMDGDTNNLQDVIGTPNDVNFQFVSNDGSSFTEELRVDNMASDARIRWVGGFYYLSDEETRVEQLRFQQRGARGGPFVPTTRQTGGTDNTDSWSVFGEITLDLGDRSSITYGGRYVKDDKTYITRALGWGTNKQLAGLPGVGPGVDGVAQVCPLAGPPNPTCGSATNPVTMGEFKQNTSWDRYVSKLSWKFDINDNLNAYALYSEGFKSGTYQPDALNRAQASVVVNPESSANLEIGFKGASSRYRYAVTGFLMEVEDVQTINLVPVGLAFVGLISNVGAIKTQGLEFDGAVLITDNFQLSGNFALLESELKNTLDPTGTGQDLSGMRPPGAPDWTYNIIGEYTFNLAGGSSLTLRADYRGRSDVFNQTSNRFTNPPLRLRPQINDWGARVTWRSAEDHYSVALWGKNLSEDYDISNFGPPSPCCSTFAADFRGKREYGLTANYNFGG